jgi:lipopolysaccharide/colanic/teichoic acid biosynthesis glycosyltransferase
MSRDLRLEGVGRRARIRVSMRTDIAKRTLDLTLATVLVLIFSPALLVVAIAVAVSSRGPILFRQTRLGRGQLGFVMLKFRTMVDGSDDEIHREFVTNMFRSNGEGAGDRELHKLIEDPRITAIGRILRRFSLDELPQLFNVITGDMSLVGPRPALPEEVATYDAATRRRLAVKPGITGLWQVSGRADLSWEESVRLDLFYADNVRLLDDLAITARTVVAVTQGRGAY